MKVRRIFLMMFAVAVMIAGCKKYDDSDVRSDIDDLKQRVTTLEEATAALKTRLDAGHLVKSVTPLTEAPGGWRIEFTGGNPSVIDILSTESNVSNPSPTTLQIEVRTGAGGSATVWYDAGEGWTDTGVNIAGQAGGQGQQGAPGISPIVRLDDRGDNLVVIQYNITEGYPDDKWEDAGDPIALDSNPDDLEAIYSIAKNQAAGTITITMNDSDVAEERTVFDFAMASMVARIELVGFNDKVAITEGETAEIRFRVNPSNTYVPLTLDSWQLDQTGIRETRASYVTAPTDFELASIEKDGDRDGQYIATIECLAYNPAVADYAMALVLNTGTAEAPALVSSPTFVLGTEAIPVTGVSLDKSSLVLGVGESATLTATVTPAGATNKAVSWAVTEGEDVATVDQNGEVTVVKAGTATVTATTADGGKTAVCTVVVIEKVLIPAGTFLMGSPASEPGRDSDETQHEVTLTKDFYMSRYEITTVQYAAFLNAEGIGSDGRGDVAGSDRMLVYSHEWGVTYADGAWKPQAGYENHPVVNVTWYGATAYADWVGGALPTEAQWEYACRAGSTTAFSYGDAANGDYMWYDDNPGITTHEVGQKLPNDWGLYDMHGNAIEWCADRYGDYPAGPATDPAGSASGSPRVVRGDFWDNDAQHCRSALRNYHSPNEDSIGFRVVFPAP